MTVKKMTVNVRTFFVSSKTYIHARFHTSGQIALYESEKAALQSKIDALKAKPPKEKKKKEKKEKAPVASTSKAPPKQPKAPSKKKSKKNVTDDDVLTFEQKKDLSESIGKLDGTRLERVIQIIHEGVPEIRDVSRPPILMHCLHSVLTSAISLSYRALRKSSWRLINYQQQSSRSYTTTSSDRCVNPPSPSGTARAKVRVLVASNGRAWTKRRRPRRSGSSKNAWPSSRVVVLRSLPLFAGPTTASIHLIRALAQTVRAANRSKTPFLAHRYHFLFVAADMPSSLVAAFGRLFRLRVFRPSHIHTSPGLVVVISIFLPTGASSLSCSCTIPVVSSLPFATDVVHKFLPVDCRPGIEPKPLLIHTIERSPQSVAI